MKKSNRREFILQAGLLGITLSKSDRMLIPSNHSDSLELPTSNIDHIILFQGDSITDGNRTRNEDWNHLMGHGYAYLVASRSWFELPENALMFYNRGISGNTISDLAQRWQEDTLDLKPNLISILAGINDVHAIVHQRSKQTIKAFEQEFSALLERTKKALPQTKLVLCEPFTLPVGQVLEHQKVWEDETRKRQKVIKKLSKSFDTLYVPLQEPFTLACKRAPANYWIWDGIHPMPAGHELIAREWLKVVQKEVDYLG